MIITARRRWSLAVPALLAVSLVAPLEAGTPAQARTTDAVIAAMSPAAQASLLQPLRRLAGLLDTQGRTAWSSSYAGVEIDAPNDAVDLFTTDAADGQALLSAAGRITPAAQWRRVRLRRGAYSRVALDRAAREILTAPGHSQVRAVSVAADGSGLVVDADGGASPTRMVPPALGVALDVRPAPTRSVKSWADAKWHDSTPFIGGDVLTANGYGHCTAGLPAIRRSDRTPVVITASHCFAPGQRIYTEAGTTGAFGNGRIGNYVGTVGPRNREWDAEPLTGANNNADESDTTGWKPLSSVGYSYVGDYVCHDGAASFYLRHPTPCGIKVTDGDIWFAIGARMARGVEGIDVRTGWGCHNGDSGATVFAGEPNGRRQARGIISSGGLDGTPDQKRVDWTEAVDIFASFGLELNPHV